MEDLLSWAFFVHPHSIKTGTRLFHLDNSNLGYGDFKCKICHVVLGLLAKDDTLIKLAGEQWRIMGTCHMSSQERTFSDRDSSFCSNFQILHECHISHPHLHPQPHPPMPPNITYPIICIPIRLLALKDSKVCMELHVFSLLVSNGAAHDLWKAMALLHKPFCCYRSPKLNKYH